MLRILIRNIISNWLGYAVQAVVAFFLTPFVLHSLGDTRYGIWALVIGLTGYYGLLDLGFRSGITQYMTRHLAERDYERLSRTASTAFVAFCFCAGLITLVSIILSWLVPTIFNIPPDTVFETRWCILIIGVSTAIEFLCFPFSAVLTATQRYDMSNAIGISTRLLTAAVTFLALKLGYGLMGLSVVNAAGNLIGYSLRWKVAKKILPELIISPGLASIEGLWPITTFSIWSLLINGAQQLKAYMGTILIGLFMPVAAIAPYTLAAGLILYFDNAITPIAIVFFPTVTHLDAKGEIQLLRTVYLVGSKVLLLLALAGSIISAVWAADFFRLWVGPKYTDHVEYSSVAVLYYLLLPGIVFTLTQRIGNQILYGTRRLKRIGAVLASEAIMNLTLTVCLIRSYGLIGVVVSGIISALIFQAIVHPIVVCWALGIPGMTYLQKVYLRPIAVGIVLSAMILSIRNIFPVITTWPQLFLSGALTGIIAMIPVAFLGLDADERNQMIMGPLTRVGQYLGLLKPT